MRRLHAFADLSALAPIGDPTGLPIGTPGRIIGKPEKDDRIAVMELPYIVYSPC